MPPFADAVQSASSAEAAHYLYLESYSDELNLRKALHRKNGIVIMGSSELNYPSEAIPYIFLPKTLNIPCTALGSGGNSSLLISLQIAALHEDFRHSKLVILLSPGWFWGPVAAYGVRANFFLDFIPERFLYRLWFDPDVPMNLKEQLGDYIVEHYGDLSSPSSILELIYFNRRNQTSRVRQIFDFPLVAFHKGSVALKQTIIDSLYDRRLMSAPLQTQRTIDIDTTIPSPPTDLPDMQWAALMDDSLRRFAAETPGPTPQGKFYDAEVRRFVNALNAQPLPVEKNHEYRHFLSLLSTLTYYGIRPLFVIQPLNPDAYPNLSELDPVINLVRQQLTVGGMPFLDLYGMARPKHVQGMLFDHAHPADYGWYLINRKIYQHWQ